MPIHVLNTILTVLLLVMTGVLFRWMVCMDEKLGKLQRRIDSLGRRDAVQQASSRIDAVEGVRAAEQHDRETGGKLDRIIEGQR